MRTGLDGKIDGLQRGLDGKIDALRAEVKQGLAELRLEFYDKNAALEKRNITIEARVERLEHQRGPLVRP